MWLLIAGVCDGLETQNRKFWKYRPEDENLSLVGDTVTTWKTKFKVSWTLIQYENHFYGLAQDCGKSSFVLSHQPKHKDNHYIEKMVVRSSHL